MAAIVPTSGKEIVKQKSESGRPAPSNERASAGIGSGTVRSSCKVPDAPLRMDAVVRLL